MVSKVHLGLAPDYADPRDDDDGLTLKCKELHLAPINYIDTHFALRSARGRLPPSLLPDF